MEEQDAKAILPLQRRLSANGVLGTAVMAAPAALVAKEVSAEGVEPVAR
jgi:hypothetical protein